MYSYRVTSFTAENIVLSCFVFCDIQQKYCEQFFNHVNWCFNNQMEIKCFISEKH